MKQRKKFRYVELADQIQDQIEQGVLRPSQSLPSLRILCQKTGFSMTTVLQAYMELEKRGKVIARERSGYYIRPARIRALPAIPPLRPVAREIRMDDLIYQLTLDMGEPGLVKLGSVTVSADLLPVKSLNRHLKSLPADRSDAIIAGYVHPAGAVELRLQIVNLLFPLIPGVSQEDIIVTSGCTESLSLAIRAVTRPGDTVIIESPSDPWLRQAVQDSGLYALEVPAHPVLGIDLDAVGQLVKSHNITACLVNPNCQNPLGFIMPDDRKKALLALLSPLGIPIVENDVLGDLHFSGHRPRPIKSWEKEKGDVIYCSSFSKMLSPGLRVGWIIPGRFKPRVERMKLNRSLISPALNQMVVSAYLRGGAFARHLIRLRQHLRHQMQCCTEAVNRYFPEQIRMTAPAGGLSLWIELPPGVQGRAVYLAARQKGITVLPGFLCTSFKGFDPYIRLSYGQKWDLAMETAVRELGQIIQGMS